MPIQRFVDTDKRILWTTMRGAITMPELRDHLASVHELAIPEYCEIVDAREAEPTFSAKEFPAIATEAHHLFGHQSLPPRAVVVSPNDLVSFGLARIFAALVAPWVTVRVFDNLTAATDYAQAMAQTIK